MKGICTKWGRNQEFTHQTLWEGSHILSLVFLCVIHTMWQGCKGIVTLRTAFIKKITNKIEIFFIIFLVNTISAFFISVRNVMICSSNHCYIFRLQKSALHQYIIVILFFSVSLLEIPYDHSHHAIRHILFCGKLMDHPWPFLWHVTSKCAVGWSSVESFETNKLPVAAISLLWLPKLISMLNHLSDVRAMSWKQNNVSTAS